MNQMIRSTLTSLVLAAASLAGTAHAQFAPSVIKVHIPFEFNLGAKTFPAGDYSVAQPLQHFLTLRDERGRTIASSFTNWAQSSAAPGKPALRFQVSGGQRTLAEVWDPEDGVSQQLPAAKSRVSVAKHESVDAELITGGTKP